MFFSIVPGLEDRTNTNFNEVEPVRDMNALLENVSQIFSLKRNHEADVLMDIFGKYNREILKSIPQITLSSYDFFVLFATKTVRAINLLKHVKYKAV